MATLMLAVERRFMFLVWVIASLCNLYEMNMYFLWQKRFLQLLNECSRVFYVHFSTKDFVNATKILNRPTFRFVSPNPNATYRKCKWKIVMYSMKTIRDIGDYIFHYCRHHNRFKSPVNLVLYTSTKMFLRYTMSSKIHASVTSFLLEQSTKKGKTDLIQALWARRKSFYKRKTKLYITETSHYPAYVSVPTGIT